MKKTITILALTISSVLCAQSFKTEYLMPNGSRVCVNKPKNFVLYETYIEVADISKPLNEKIWSPAKLTDSGYTEQAYYYETFSPVFFLNEYGIDQYNRLPYRYTFQIVYEKEGGNPLYVKMMNNDNKRVEFYLTENANYLCNEIRY